MRAILFDLDGTLIDSTEGILESFSEAFNSQNFPQARAEDICSLIGHPLDIMFEKLGVSRDRVDIFVDEYKKHYRKISLQKTSLLPSAYEAVKLAYTIAPLGVVTTKTARYSKDILENFGILKYFKAVIGREDVKNPKPHAEPILKALKMLHVKPDMNSFMIGDTCLDINSAKNAKIGSIGVLSGYGTRDDLQKCALHVKDNSLQAIEFLLKCV